MSSIRTLVLCSVGCLVLAATSVLTFAQPGSTPPTPPAAPTAPKDQPGSDKPGSDKPRTDPQDQPAPRGQPGEGRRGPGGAGGDGAPASVRAGMSMMNRALRTLKGQVADASKKDENLRLISDMQRGCLAAKGAVPDRALGRIDDAAKKAEMGVAYRKSLIAMMDKMLKLETAVIDGKPAEAATLIDEIGTLRDDSHQKMGVRMGGGGGDR